jgi:hypothetical protein
MDLQSLTQLFATTYDSNPNTRKTGELAVRKVRALRVVASFVEWHRVFCAVVKLTSSLVLFTRQLAGQEGVIPALLQIIASDNVEMYVQSTARSSLVP